MLVLRCSSVRDAQGTLAQDQANQAPTMTRQRASRTHRTCLPSIGSASQPVTEASAPKADEQSVLAENDLSCLFSGSRDVGAPMVDGQAFGGDGVWDRSESSKKKGDQQMWGWRMIGANTGRFESNSKSSWQHGKGENHDSTPRSRSRSHYNRDWTESKCSRQENDHRARARSLGSPSVVINGE